MAVSQNIKEKELNRLQKKEQAYIKKHSKEKQSFINEKLDKVVPVKLKETLNAAFIKAFSLIFEKGTSLIEKTTGRDNIEYQYKVNEYAMGLREDKKSLRAFSKQAASKRTMNMLASGVEGAGLGFLGIGIPDIPLFTGVLLKSVYEIALSYGYEYQDDAEKIFILKLIETAMTDGEILAQKDEELNHLFEKEWLAGDREGQIKATASVLAEQMLYMKFIQGIPIAGLLGGLGDCVYLNRITEYALLKYNRRFLTDRIKRGEVTL